MGATQSTALPPSNGYEPSPVTACPSVSTSTVTSYSSTTPIYPTTFTSTLPIYPNIEYFYFSTVSTYFESPLQTTVSSTFYLNTTIVVIPAQTTVTVPTPSGFTPVLCEAAWVQPTTSVTGVLTLTYTETRYFESTDLSTTTSTGTLLTGDTTSTIPTTVTVTATISATTPFTSTRNEATSTVYEACATNNVVQLVPDGQNIYNVDYLPIYDSASTTAIDEYDCCALCQANSTCAGSVYLAKTFYTQLGTRRCFLLFSRDGVCDPTSSGANVTVKAAENPYVQLFISNSGCGQILYAPDLYQQIIR